MIVRVRSPLFIFHVLAALVTGLCFGMRWEIAEGRESFMRTDSFQIVNSLVAWGLGLGLVAMVVLALMELALHRGWDPPFLRIRLYGATILDVDPPASTGVNWRVTVRHPDGEDHTYLAEENEASGMKVGDIYRLDVFGQHVVGHKLLERSASVSPVLTSTQKALRSLRVNTTTSYWSARLFMLAGFPVTATLIGGNLLPLFYREDVVSVSSRYSRQRTYTLWGEEAILTNLLWVAPASVAFLALAWYWLKGWDAEDLQYQLTTPDPDTYSGRRSIFFRRF